MLLVTDKLVKSILDPIHGMIRMTEEEFKIISHPLFNRLRRIKQNSFLYYVFPSANHTRFEHSIGVMHLASQIYINAFINSDTIKQKQGLTNFDNNLLTSKDINQEQFEKFFYDLRIAALLHDIGHGPMSHLFDSFAPTNQEFLDMLSMDKNDKIFKELKVSLGQIVGNELDKHIEHECVSYLLTAKILKDLEFEDERIKAIITIMNYKLGLSIYKVNEFDISFFLNQIVASAPLDCDRMDYLLRDSYFTGVKYGNYDLNRLLKTILPFKNNNQIMLGIKKSGLPAVENFLQARYELYLQIYFHKTNRACNTMLNYATQKLREDNHKFVNCDSLDEFIEYYLDISDEKFLSSVYSKLDKENKDIIVNLNNRVLWKRFYEEEYKNEDKQLIISKIENAIKECSQNLNIKLELDLIENNPLKDIDKSSVLLKKDISGIYDIEKENGWVEESPIFKALSNKFLVARVFIDNSNNYTVQNLKDYKNTFKEYLNN